LAPSPLPGDADNAVLKWLQTSFALLSPGEQNLALLMRALVAKPGLIILDEAFAGMDDATVEKVRRYLNEKIGEDQAVIFVGHWSSEVPWSKRTGLKLFKLQEGTGTAEE
jgi:ABC-type molybdenum transport system ATPase subunit/photorepair protein PhrA